MKLFAAGRAQRSLKIALVKVNELAACKTLASNYLLARPLLFVRWAKRRACATSDGQLPSDEATFIAALRWSRNTQLAARLATLNCIDCGDKPPAAFAP